MTGTIVQKKTNEASSATVDSVTPTMVARPRALAAMGSRRANVVRASTATTSTRAQSISYVRAGQTKNRY